ncbi:hypothetical protein QGP82_23740 [Leptothoe sp. LEGE 181152]|nr:hypothetical protein [Leptothoe sp. LEGE 181152]
MNTSPDEAKPPVVIEYHPNVPGWTWEVQTPDGPAKSMDYFPSSSEAMIDGLDAYRLAQHQHQAMLILSSAVSIARQQGISNYDLIQGFASLTFASDDKDFKKATGHLERAAYATIGETSFLDDPEALYSLMERINEQRS